MSLLSSFAYCQQNDGRVCCIYDTFTHVLLFGCFSFSSFDAFFLGFCTASHFQQILSGLQTINISLIFNWYLAVVLAARSPSSIMW